MKAKHRTAIDLLFSYPEPVVAEMLGIRLATLRNWLKMPEFTQALRQREREHRIAAARMAGQAVMNSAAALCKITENKTSPDTKVLLDLLKAASAFDKQVEDPGADLKEIIRRVSQEEPNEQP